MPESSRRKLYDAISGTYDIGTFEEFDSKMNSPESRKKLYDFAISKDFDLGNYDEFESKISSSPKLSSGTFSQDVSQGLGITRPKAPLNAKAAPTKSAVTPAKVLSEDQLQAAVGESVKDINKPDIPSYAKKVKPVADYINTGEVPEGEDPDYISRLGDRALRGLNSLNKMIVETPEFIYNLAAVPQNVIAEQFDIPELAVSAEKVKKDLGIENQAANYYQDKIDQLAYLDKKYDSSIEEYLKKGDFSNAAKLAGELIAESAPTTAVIAATGGMGASRASLTMGGGLVFGAGKYEELRDRTDIPESQKSLIAFSSGLMEGLFEGSGTGQLGKISRDILVKSASKELAQQEIKKTFVDAYKTAIKKYMPISGAIQEGIEEAATTFTENVIDKYSGVDSERDLREGVVDSFIVGTGSGAIVSSPTLLSKKRNDQVEKANTELSEINKALDDPNLTPTSKKELLAVRDDLIEDISNVTEQDVAEQKTLPEEVKREIESLKTEQEELAADLETTENETAKKIIEDKIKSIDDRLSQISEQTVKANEQAEKTTEESAKVTTDTNVPDGQDDKDQSLLQKELKKIGAPDKLINAISKDVKLRESFLTDRKQLVSSIFGLAGNYNVKENEIKIGKLYSNLTGGGRNKVLLHEAVHAATMTTLGDMYDNPQDYTQEQISAAKELSEIASKYTENTSSGAKMAIPTLYGTLNNFEFIAEFISNKKFRKWVGENSPEKRTDIISYVWDKILQVIGINKKEINTERLSKIDELIDQTLEAATEKPLKEVDQKSGEIIPRTTKITEQIKSNPETEGIKNILVKAGKVVFTSEGKIKDVKQNSGESSQLFNDLAAITGDRGAALEKYLKIKDDKGEFKKTHSDWENAIMKEYGRAGLEYEIKRGKPKGANENSFFWTKESPTGKLQIIFNDNKSRRPEKFKEAKQDYISQIDSEIEKATEDDKVKLKEYKELFEINVQSIRDLKLQMIHEALIDKMKGEVTAEDKIKSIIEVGRLRNIPLAKDYLGEPMIFMHSGKEGLDQIIGPKQKGYEQNDALTGDIGIYFTRDQKSTKEMYANWKDNKPGEGKDIYYSFLKTRNPYYVTDPKAQQDYPLGNSASLYDEDVLQLTMKGYDSVIWDKEGSPKYEVVVFDPDQVEIIGSYKKGLIDHKIKQEEPSLTEDESNLNKETAPDQQMESKTDGEDKIEREGERPRQNVLNPEAGVEESTPAPSERTKKTLVTKRAYEGEVRKGVKKELEKVGLDRSIDDFDTAAAKAKKIVDEIGVDLALDAVRSGDIAGSAAAFVWNEALDSINDKLSVATNPDEISELERMEAEWLDEWGKSQWQAGAFNSAMQRILVDSSLSLKQRIQEFKNQNGGEIPVEVEAKFRDLDRQLKELNKRIAEAESRAKELESNQIIANIKEANQRQNNNKRIKTAAKTLADKLRKGKLSRPGAFSAATPASLVWDTAIEAVATTIEAGGTIAQAIENGLTIIKSSKWYKSLTSDKQVEAEKEYTGFVNEQQATSDSDVEVSKELIRELVERGIDDIEELTDAVIENIGIEKTDENHRRIRDIITGYGKTINLSQEEIDVQIRKLKRIGRIISGLEDVRERQKRPLRSGIQRDKLDAEERAKAKELREAMKGLPVDEEAQENQLKVQIDSAKQRIRNQIEDLEKEINSGERVPTNARTVTADEELTKLRKKRDQLKEQYEEIFKDDGYKEAKRLELAKVRVQATLEDLQKRLKDGDFTKKKSTALVADDELVKLRAEKLRIKEEYDKEFYKNQLQNRSKIEKFQDTMWDIWGITRLLSATMDFSFIGVQGLINTVAHPVHAFNAAKRSAQFFASEKKSEEWLRMIKQQEWYPELKGSKLALTEPHVQATAREELSYNNYWDLVWEGLSKLLTFGNDKAYEVAKNFNPLRALERAAVGYLDTLRLIRWLDGKKMLELQGKTYEKNKESFVKMADVINTFSGRASLGAFERNAETLSKLFFSPRNWASGIKQTILLPRQVYKWRDSESYKPSVAQKIALRDFGTFVGLTSSLVLLLAASLNNDDDPETKVETDPRSSEFGKIRIKNKVIDPWGGKIQYITYIARIIMDSIVTKKGEEIPLGTPFKSPTKTELTIQQAVNKLSPSASLVEEYMSSRERKDGTRVSKYGKPFEWPEELRKRLTPIYFGTTKELLQDDPQSLDWLLTFYTLLGGNVRVDEKREKQ